MKKTRTSVSQMMHRAAGGDAFAQCTLALAYLEGKGVKRDYLQARRWLIKAAAQGDTDAMFNLGLLYETGDGIAFSRRRAIHWYRAAAEAGDVQAQVNLGLMYIAGRKRILGAELLKKAAKKGDPTALYNLGVAYLRGDGVAQNQQLARRHIQRAGDLGELSAKRYIKEMRGNRDIHDR